MLGFLAFMSYLGGAIMIYLSNSEIHNFLKKIDILGLKSLDKYDLTYLDKDKICNIFKTNCIVH